eukprot:11992519-Heterocapsa_arctica.AAC.1
MPEAELEGHDTSEEQGFDWQGGEDEFMDQDAAEHENPEGQPAPGGEGHRQHTSAEDRISAMRCRIISRELAALPLDLSAVQATRKRILEFELDVLGDRAVRPK